MSSPSWLCSGQGEWCSAWDIGVDVLSIVLSPCQIRPREDVGQLGEMSAENVSFFAEMEQG